MRTNIQQQYSSIKSILLVALFLMTSQALYSQPDLTGFGVEIGYGSSQLFTKHLLTPLRVYRSEATYFDITPEVRLNYNFHLSDKYTCMPFVGYNSLNGSYIVSYLDQYGSEKIVAATWVHVLETGLITTYNLSNFSFGIGYKINRLFRTTDIYVFPKIALDRYRAWSHDAGLRVSYILSHYNFSAESWFGISDVERNSEIWNVRQNHFRILFGYTR